MARRAGSDGAKTEAAIRAAALKLIARHGYEALSMRQLGDAVDLGAAALYRYFPTKQSILFSLLSAHMDDLLEAWDAARLSSASTPEARLEAFARFHIRHHLPRPDGVFLSYMELRSLTPENFVKIETMRQRYEAGLAEILEAGRASGAFACEAPAVTTRAIIAMLTGITTWYRSGGQLNPAEIEEIYWNMVARLAGVRVEEIA